MNETSIGFPPGAPRDGSAEWTDALVVVAPVLIALLYLARMFGLFGKKRAGCASCPGGCSCSTADPGKRGKT